MIVDKQSQHYTSLDLVEISLEFSVSNRTLSTLDILSVEDILESIFGFALSKLLLRCSSLSCLSTSCICLTRSHASAIVTTIPVAMASSIRFSVSLPTRYAPQ